MSEIRVNKIDDSGQGYVEAITRIKTNLAPIDGTDLANKSYVDSVNVASGVDADYVDGRDLYYYSQVNASFVHKTGSVNEDVTGLKTFEVAPRTNDLPNLGSDITNKSYVDAQDQSTLNTAKRYTDSKTSNNVLGWTSYFFPNQIYIDSEGKTSQFSASAATYFGSHSIQGTGGISVYGVTGATVGGDGQTYQKLTLTVDGGGNDLWYASTTDTNIGSGTITSKTTEQLDPSGGLGTSGYTVSSSGIYEVWIAGECRYTDGSSSSFSFTRKRGASTTTIKTQTFGHVAGPQVANIHSKVYVQCLSGDILNITLTTSLGNNTFQNISWGGRKIG